jgi:hypothetical protein
MQFFLSKKKNTIYEFNITPPPLFTCLGEGQIERGQCEVRTILPFFSDKISTAMGSKVICDLTLLFYCAISVKSKKA